MSTTASPQVRARIPDHVVARWAGGLALGHIVLLLGGFALEAAPVAHGEAPSKALHAYAQVNMTRTMTGGYIEALAFVVLLPALVLVARSLARRTDLGRLATQVFVGLGVAFVASTLATGFPPGAAAIYAAQHGVDATTVATVNDIRNYAYVLQVMLTAAMALCVGVASLVEVPAMAISSTDCRRRVAAGAPVWYLVPDGVVQYISKYSLYAPASQPTKKLGPT